MPADIRALAPDEFPPLLREIPDPPEHLYLRGTFPSPDEYAYLCVVGSRNGSYYGLRTCLSLIAGLAGIPVAIVSGLALGIDAQAHEAALQAGLPTVAVLPSGLGDSTIYPSTNRNLALRILRAGGALVSEYESGFQAARWTFSARNRVMADLSRATLIVEAGEQSGTLITARLALDYNREVLVVPHPIDSRHGAGSNRLIREGALLVRSSDDILDARSALRGRRRAGANCRPISPTPSARSSRRSPNRSRATSSSSAPRSPRKRSTSRFPPSPSADFSPSAWAR
jgi:DNA processing protein